MQITRGMSAAALKINIKSRRPLNESSAAGDEQNFCSRWRSTTDRIRANVNFENLTLMIGDESTRPTSSERRAAAKHAGQREMRRAPHKKRPPPP